MIKQDYYATDSQGNCVNYGFNCSHWHGYFDNGSCDMVKTTFTTISSGDAMTKRKYWDESEKRKKFQKDVQRKINSLLVEYELEYENTPFYQNTSNCQLEGAINELKSIDVKEIDYQGAGCYLCGRIEVLKKLKKIIVFGDDIDD